MIKTARKLLKTKLINLEKDDLGKGQGSSRQRVKKIPVIRRLDFWVGPASSIKGKAVMRTECSITLFGPLLDKGGEYY